MEEKVHYRADLRRDFWTQQTFTLNPQTVSLSPNVVILHADKYL